MTDDPSQVDSATLKRSQERDIREALLEDNVVQRQRWLQEAIATGAELLRREAAKSRP